jgi:hypothetical protein
VDRPAQAEGIGSLRFLSLSPGTAGAGSNREMVGRRMRRWQMANGGWQMADGKWQMTDDERRGNNGGLSPSAICHRGLSSLWPTPGRCLGLASLSLRSKQSRNDAEPPHASPACPGRVPASGSGFPGARDDRTWQHDVFCTRLAALAAINRKRNQPP